MILPILRFSGEYHFLSNFYPSELIWNNYLYATSEHAYQAAKATDYDSWYLIANAESPSLAKKLGSRVSISLDWDNKKISVMRSILEEKFIQNPDIQHQLIDTYPRPLIEGNAWGDIYWGQSPIGVGENHLGKLLMELRENLIFGK